MLERNLEFMMDPVATLHAFRGTGLLSVVTVLCAVTKWLTSEA